MNTYSSIFLLVGASFYLVLFGIPLFVNPMGWARKIGWKIPEEKDLANYLGRSLGGISLPVIIVAYLAAIKPWEYRFLFVLVILIGVFQVLVHGYGFIRRTQPLIEHLEIILYALLSVFAWYFYPQPPI